MLSVVRLTCGMVRRCVEKQGVKILLNGTNILVWIVWYLLLDQ